MHEGQLKIVDVIRHVTIYMITSMVIFTCEKVSILIVLNTIDFGTICINKLKTIKRCHYKHFLLSEHIPYNKLEKKHCNDDKYGIYSSVQDAMAVCSGDSNCISVYDGNCDESKDNVYLCPVGSSYANSAKSCIYEKGI